MKKYKIIYADPAWQYNDSQKSGGTDYFGASARYNTMSLEEIKALPVREFSDKDCVLFIWAVSPLLPEALEVIASWGFKFKTVAFCWNKVTANLAQIYNMGRWTMGSVEICLLATKGNPKRIRKDVKQIVFAKRTEHSKKPSVVRQRIVDLMGDLPRIELFAREETDGWDSWGNESNKFTDKNLKLL